MATNAAVVRPGKLTFRDRISRLTFHQACKLLGDQGPALMRSAAKWEIDPEQHVYVGGDVYRVHVPDVDLPRGAVVILTQMTSRRQELHLCCEECERPCAHAAAAVQFLLDNKLALGLSAPPDETVPLELLTREELLERAIAERQLRAATEKMKLQAIDASTPWSDYTVTSLGSGKSYRVSLRGEEPGRSFCSCPDFRTNHLGTCKHILHVLEKVRKRFRKKDLAQAYELRQFEVWLDYSEQGGLRFNVPADADAKSRNLCDGVIESPTTDAADVLRRVKALQKRGHEVLVYPDAEEWIEQELTLARLRETTAEFRRNPEKHPLRKQLLKVELLPYQFDGIAFAAGAGRAVLADDMGLGKTIQGIGTAELLAQLAGIQRVLVDCPASLKSQWRDEVQRFCDRSVQLVMGGADERAGQYTGRAFFTVCNYEQVLRDLDLVERAEWDLIILDEGQRIKNWESRTSQVMRSLRSRFALVLSGTPLENRLEELYTVVRFIDPRRLGPAYQFLHRHRIVGETGRVEGYRDLDKLRADLKPILLRRTRNEVMRQLPERTTSIVRVTPTAEQLAIHDGAMQQVWQITGKKFLTEMDLLRLQKYLLLARMAADSTFLVDKQPPGYSSKLDRLEELLGDLAAQGDRKIVLFSEWRRMLDCIEPILQRVGMDFVRLDGQIPQQQRPALIRKFQEDPDCRVIMMTNAGATGLNLQAANTVINVDLPWNPAVLEQRIARAHRMGQKNPVHVYLLVTEETLEEKLLGTLAAKQQLALAALDAESDVSEVELHSGMEELKRRLEQLLGKQPDAPVDQSRQQAVQAETQRIAQHRERVAAAGGQLVDAALQLVGELIAGQQQSAPDPDVVNRLRDGLAETIDRDGDGRPRLQITLPDDHALSRFAESLARLLVTK